MKLISLNIEGRRHLDRLPRFFKQHPADVVCLQEVFGVDMKHLSEIIGAEGYFEPMVLMTEENKFTDQLFGEYGIALFSKHPVEITRHVYVPESGRITTLC